MTRILVALSAVLAIAYGLLAPGWYDAGVSHVALAALKCSSIVILALIAIWTAGVSPTGDNGAELERAASGSANGPQASATRGRALQPSNTSHNKLLTAALLFGAAGDALLALGRDTFLAGALAFLIGHLCYIALFLRAGIGDRATLRRAWRLAAMLVIAASAIVMTSLLVPRDNALFGPLGIYTGVLTLMTMTSFTLPASRWLAMLGAVLFFISDGFVAAHIFHPIADPTLAYWSSFAGWMIYWAGQACLCVGALGLHKPLRT